MAHPAEPCASSVTGPASLSTLSDNAEKEDSLDREMPDKVRLVPDASASSAGQKVGTRSEACLVKGSMLREMRNVPGIPTVCA